MRQTGSLTARMVLSQFHDGSTISARCTRVCDLKPGPELVGTRVRNAARPEWGEGQVLRVQRVRVGDRPAHRVSVQFAVGQRTLLVPPARLTGSRREPQRESSWLAGLGKRTLDDQLRALPERVVHVLGTPRERLSAVFPLYALSRDSASLLRWACSQTGVTDPLSHWTRDELMAAFRDFSTERDAHLRSVAALVRQSEGPQALDETLAAVPEPLRQAVLSALRRPI